MSITIISYYIPHPQHIKNNLGITWKKAFFYYYYNFLIGMSLDDKLYIIYI